MSHVALIPEVARAHQSDLRRSAARRHLVALARCCQPSRIAAAIRAYRERQASAAAPCCA